MAMTDLELQICDAKLRKMFAPDAWFSICDFDVLVRLTGVSVSRRDHDVLALLHCLHWRDLPADLRRSTAARVVELLQQPTFDIGELLGDPKPTPVAAAAETPVPAKTGLFHRLLS
jgi:hypothetical protein